MAESLPESSQDFDVLVVGAGPTGLTLAAQLTRFGVRFRIIDKQVDRFRESRALGVQARSLEVLQMLGLGEELVRRGSSTARLMLHVDRREPPIIDLGNVGRADTRFPFILFVSQAETEGVLAGYLASHGVTIGMVYRALLLEKDLLPEILVADALPEDIKALARKRAAAT